MPITALTPLDRTAATFKADVDEFFGVDLPLFSAQAESARVEINAKAVEAAASAAAALASEMAIASGGGSIAIWVTGTSYAIGDVRYSPANSLSYRRRTTGAGSTDPSSDPTNWAQLVSLPTQTGFADAYLSTNGTVASWKPAPAVTNVLNQLHYGGF